MRVCVNVFFNSQGHFYAAQQKLLTDCEQTLLEKARLMEELADWLQAHPSLQLSIRANRCCLTQKLTTDCTQALHWNPGLLEELAEWLLGCSGNRLF